MLLNNHVGSMMYVSSQGDGLVDKKHGVRVCGLGVIWGYSILNHPIQKYMPYCSVFVHSPLSWTKQFSEVFCFWYFIHLLLCKREWCQMKSLPKITTGLAHKSHRHTHITSWCMRIGYILIIWFILIYVIFIFRSWRSRWYITLRILKSWKCTVNCCHLLDMK